MLTGAEVGRAQEVNGMRKYVVTERAGVGVKHDGKLYAPGEVIEAGAREMKALV